MDTGSGSPFAGGGGRPPEAASPLGPGGILGRLAAVAAGVLKDVQLTPNQILMQSNVARLAQADQTPGHVMNLTG